MRHPSEVQTEGRDGVGRRKGIETKGLLPPELDPFQKNSCPFHPYLAEAQP